MHSRTFRRLRFVMLPALVVLGACSRHHGARPPVGGAYAVADALAVGNGVVLGGATNATAYFAPQPAGSAAPAASLAGDGQIVYAPDRSLYRYSNGPGGCAIAKYAFGAIGNAAPLATATGDPNLAGSALPLGCYAAATDSASNLYVLVVNGTYLGVDVFDPQLAFQGQLGNGPASGIFASGRIPSMPLAIDALGNLFVGQGTKIVNFSTSDRGDVAPAASLAISAPAVSLITDGTGALYVGSTSSVSVIPAGSTVPTTVLNLPTNSLVPSSSLQLKTSNGLALDSKGNLYVLTVGGNTVSMQVLRYPASSSGNAGYVASLAVGPQAQSISVAP